MIETIKAVGIANALRVTTWWTTLITWPLLLYYAWSPSTDWSYQPDVTAPLTRKLLFFHPASAWASFILYFIVFAASVAYLNERKKHYDQVASAAAEVGFVCNTIALITGTLWGIQEWSRTGQSSLATVYTEPKVLIVVVLWTTFAAYLLLRQNMDDPEREARLAAIFGILGFVAVPLAFMSSRILQTSLHPDIGGPGKNPDAAVGSDIAGIIGLSLLAFTSLFLHLFLQRYRLKQLEDTHGQ